jgi:hypothetical protein
VDVINASSTGETRITPRVNTHMQLRLPGFPLAELWRAKISL